jgi:hypothetical protein
VKPKTILIFVLSSAILLDGVTLVYANQKLIAVRKAYFTTTGKKWDDATSREKEKFLKRFFTEENRTNRNEEYIKRKQSREEAREVRERDREYAALERSRRIRERAKELEKRNWLREKKNRERELAIAKKKLIKARQKFESKKVR